MHVSMCALFLNILINLIKHEMLSSHNGAVKTLVISETKD